jgi:hypothetical protein
MTGPVARDERTLAVENASYRLAYLLMTYGLLAAVAYRAFALKQSSWDLMGLVVAGGFVATAYQGFNKVLSRRWILVTGLTAAAAAVVAIALILMRVG